MPPELQEEIQDVGRATDKPKGFVKLALIGMGSAIVGLCTFIGVLMRSNMKSTTDCSDKIEKIYQVTQATIDGIRVEYNKKLEDRIAQLEHLEQKIDSLPKSKRK